MKHCLVIIHHLLLLLLLPSVRSMRRAGRLSDRDLAHIEDMLNSVESKGEMGSIDIPPPPDSHMLHRDQRILCRIGDKDYCPGEILFRKECELTLTVQLLSLFYYVFDITSTVS